MAMGRRPKHYITSNRETIVGLSSLGNGRWRINLDGPHKGRRFNERDERLAVLKYRQIVGIDPMVTMPIASIPANHPTEQMESQETHPAHAELSASIDSVIDADGNVVFVQNVRETRMWAWCRDQIIADPINAAKRLGLPAIANLDFTMKSLTPIKLATLIDTYNQHSTANWRTRGQARSAVRRLRDITGAETIQDMTTAALMEFRDKINSQLRPAGAAQVFAKIKAVFSFGLKHGLDANQISPALARLKTLYAPPSTSEAKPQPISPGELHRLLAVADVEWRAILMLSLNMALYLEDVCTLQWKDFDLQAGTYSAGRKKTKVIRVGWLWKETVEAIKALPRKGQSPLLFTSKTGLRFNASSKYDTYKSLKERAGVTADFSGIRDGAYSAAAAVCDEKTAKLFAAHRFTGLMDAYVQRRPELVKAAADAVYAAYFPAPTNSAKKTRDANARASERYGGTPFAMRLGT
jgi:integrase